MSDELGVEPGQIIAGKYRLVSLLGRGGMGSVWRCDHLSLMSTVALKVIKPEVAKNANSVARFMREAKAAAMLRSPHIIQILDHGMDGRIAYIGMELLEGESLHQRLRARQRISSAETALVMTHVGRAMQKAHDAGIIHRDLKPDNIFLVQNDDEVIAKVLDFGIAKSSVWSLNTTGESPQTQTGALLGTPYYMSPEQATGQKDVDHRADLWGIAVITFECLVGRRPYQSDSLGDLVLQICSRPQPVPSHLARVPPGFDAWFAKAQARDPDERYQSARELTKTLRQVLTGRSAPATVGGLPRASVPPPPRRPPMPSGPRSLASPATQSVVASAPSAIPFQPPRDSEPAHPSGPGQPARSAESGAHTSLPPTLPSALHPGDGAPNITDISGTDLARPVDPTDSSNRHSLASIPAHDVALQTLDPTTATHAPKRRRMVLGSVVGAVAVVSLAIGGIYAARSGASPSDAPTDVGAAQVGDDSHAGASAVEPTPASAPVVDAAEPPSVPSVASAPSAAPSAEPAPPVQPQVQPPERPAPVAQPSRPQPPRPQPANPQPAPTPKPPPAPSDPLGI